MLKSVDVNNDILTFPFNDKILGLGEIELIFSICYACRSEKTTEIQTNIKEIRKAREYESMSDLELRESLLITGKKLLSFNILLNDEDGTSIAPFTVFHFNGETLRIRINDEFLHYFSGFVSNYTVTDVILLFSIWGKHSSILYKILRRYRGMDEPVARIKEKDLIEKLGISHIAECNFTNADLSSAKILRNQIYGSTFANANLRHAKTHQSTFNLVVFINSNVEDVDFSDTFFNGYSMGLLRHAKNLDLSSRHEAIKRGEGNDWEI